MNDTLLLGDLLIRLTILSLDVLRSPLGLTIIGLLLLGMLSYTLHTKPLPTLMGVGSESHATCRPRCEEASLRHAR